MVHLHRPRHERRAVRPSVHARPSRHNRSETMVFCDRLTHGPWGGPKQRHEKLIGTKRGGGKLRIELAAARGQPCAGRVRADPCEWNLLGRGSWPLPLRPAIASPRPAPRPASPAKSRSLFLHARVARGWTLASFSPRARFSSRIAPRRLRTLRRRSQRLRPSATLRMASRRCRRPLLLLSASAPGT